MRQFFCNQGSARCLCRRFPGKERSLLTKKRKTVVRLILFILAVVVAVGAFTAGILGLGHRESGYQDVEFTDQAKVEIYGSGLHLKYYAEGSSGEIRMKIKEVQNMYSQAALRAWRLTSADTETPGIVNLAWLNSHPGESGTLDPDLYRILEDALEKTARGEGYSLFAGPLHREWQDLRYLDEPQPFDPVMNENEAGRLARLTALVNDPASFSLALNAEDRTACLTVAPDAARTLSDLETDAPILDLNLLRDAYMLRIIARDLVSTGWTEGYLYTDSGLSVMLKAEGTAAYGIWYAAGDTAAECGETTLPSPSAYCQWTAFHPEGKRYGYYAVQDGAAVRLRHPLTDARTGGFGDLAMTVSVGCSQEEIVEAAYRGAVLFFQRDREALRACTADWPEGLFLAFTLQDEPGVLYTLPSMTERIAMNEKAGMELRAW